VLLLTLLGCSGGDGDPATEPAQARTPDAEWFVSPAGNDNWPGTEDQPWRTLGFALPQLLPNQVLYVRDGEYQEHLAQLNINDGTADEPITVMAYPGERPVVKGLFWLRQPTYWTFNGINVTADPALRPAPLALVKLTGGVGWRWVNSEIWGSQALTNVLITGYERREPRRWSFSYNCVHDVMPPEGAGRASNVTIGDMKAAGPGKVSRNLLFNVENGQNLILGSAAGGPTRVAVKFNTMYRSEVGAILVGETEQVRITRNIIGYATSGLLVRGDPKFPAVASFENTISNNLGIGATTENFLRPEVEKVVDGQANVVDASVTFTDAYDCGGFHTDAPVALPYGRYAVG